MPNDAREEQVVRLPNTVRDCPPELFYRIIVPCVARETERIDCQ